MEHTLATHLPAKRHFDCLQKTYCGCQETCARLAYPKLVVALKSALASLDQMANIGRIPANNQGARDARNLLRELGEL